MKLGVNYPLGPLDWSEKIGLKHIGALSMRKTFGYHYYQRTNDVAFLMEVFNHSSKHEVLRYIGIDFRRESLKGGFL